MNNVELHPDRLPVGFGSGAEIERMIEERVAIRAQRAALRWRLLLVVIEAVMMAALVLGAGLALKQPTAMVLRSAGLIGGACFITGVGVVGLAALSYTVIARLRRKAGR